MSPPSHSARFIPSLVGLLMIITVGGCAAGGSDLSSGIAMNEHDRSEYARNRAWMEHRRATTQPNSPAVIGVYAGPGVWHLGVTSIVDALESIHYPCRILDHQDLKADGLSGLRVLIVPGGWAPLERDANSTTAFEEIRRFVRDGGRYIGVCAGAYLATDSVLWYGETFHYPIGLFDGVADGPVRGISRYPTPTGTRLTVTDAGRKRGLASLEVADVYYNGGSSFRDGTGVTILANYPNGSAAIIARPFGLGEVVLVGVHPERPAPADGGPSLPPPTRAGKIYRALAGLDDAEHR